MSVDKVRKYLKEYNLENRIITFNGSSATVSDAAERLNVEEGMIAKTLSFKLKTRIILIVMAGDIRIDNSKFRKEFGEKAYLLALDLVEDKIGHPVGGVCPFGINDNIDIYLDISLKKYDVVYPAGGEKNNAVKIKVDELDKVLNYPKWIDIGK